MIVRLMLSIATVDLKLIQFDVRLHFRMVIVYDLKLKQTIYIEQLIDFDCVL